MTAIFNILFFLLILVRLVIGVQLLITARRSHLPNLYWLGALFLVNFAAVSFVPLPDNPLGSLPVSLWIFNGYTLVSGLILIMFLHTTFYSSTRSPALWFVSIHLLLSAVGIYGLSQTQPNATLNPWAAGLNLATAVLWTWHTVVAYQSFRSIAADEAVEDWVKARYQMMIAFAVCAIITAVTAASANQLVYGSDTILVDLGNLLILISLLGSLATVVLQFLVWVMPAGFRNWLNRNQQARTQERIRQQALVVLDILGSALCQDSGMTKMIAIYALRKIIGQYLNSEDAAQIELRAIEMGFEEWMALLNDPELYILIKDSGVRSPYQVIENARQVLIEKQSLFTMRAR